MKTTVGRWFGRKERTIDFQSKCPLFIRPDHYFSPPESPYIFRLSKSIWALVIGLHYRPTWDGKRLVLGNFSFWTHPANPPLPSLKIFWESSLWRSYHISGYSHLGMVLIFIDLGVDFDGERTTTGFITSYPQFSPSHINFPQWSIFVRIRFLSRLYWSWLGVRKQWNWDAKVFLISHPNLCPWFRPPSLSFLM